MIHGTPEPRRLRRARHVFAGAATLAAILLLAAPGGAAKDDTSLISIAQNVPGGKGNGFSGSVSPSADGRYIAFSTSANNLVADDTSTDEDVYVRDTVAETTTLITPGDGPDPAGGAQPSISDDGQRIAFMSFEDLTADDTNNESDVYVYDFDTEVITLVSRPSGTGPAPPERSNSPAISGDGATIAFVSVDNTLDPANDSDTDPRTFFSQDVFVRELNTNTTELVSRSAATDGNFASWRPSIDEDGSRVSFDTQADNLDAADTDGELDVFLRNRTTGTLTLVSRADGAAGAKANDETVGSALSGDGSEVAFVSDATNLVNADTDATRDVYVRDLAADDTELISRASGGSGAKANKIAQLATISADGTQVAFISPADNLHPDQPDVTTQNQAYVRDRATNTTRLESRADGVGGPIADTDVGEASISADGSALALASRATNLDPADADTIQDAFVREMGAGETVLVSQSPVEPPVNANGESRDPAISADGRYVAFSSMATNIDPDATNNRSDVFVRDTETGLTVLASRDGASGPEGDDSSVNPSISADGRYVAFESEAENLVAADGDGQPDIFVRDLVANTTTLASRDDGDANAGGFPAEPSISGDGMRIAFDVDIAYHPDDDNGLNDVYVRDLAAGQTLRVSRPDGVTAADGDGDSRVPDISADGSAVAFESTADNLTGDPTSAFQQAFVRRIDDDQTILVSRADGAGGALADRDVREPAISGDGSVVAFQSDSTNLDPDKTSTTTQVFVRDLNVLDTDVASRADNGAVANDASNSPDLSDDGTYVAFGSSATNLGASNTRPDAFQRDLAAGETVLASRADGAAGAEGDETSGDPVISEHGRHVAFESNASNVDPADDDPIMDVYLRDVLGADTVAPQTTITGGPAEGSLHNTNTFTFTFTVDESGSSSECRIDGGAFSPCAGSFNTSVLAQGSHTFEVRSTDRVGNIEASPASRTFTVDTVAADTTLTGQPPSATADSTPSFEFTATEGGATFQCAVDAGAFSSCSSGDTFGPLADGAHTFAVRSTDPAGNTDSTPASSAFTVDTAAPDTTLTNAPPSPVSDSSPSFEFSSTEPGSTFQCAVDGGAFSSCDSGVTVGPLADGEHSFQVRAVDAAGNTDSTPASSVTTVDTLILGREVSAKDKQKQPGNTVKVVAKVATGEAVTATLTGKVSPGKGLKLREVSKTLAAGEGAKLVGRLKRKQSDEVLEQLEDGKRMKAKLVVEITDPLDNSQTKTEKVKLAG
jgi:Tol biopolymer transport system component